MDCFITRSELSVPQLFGALVVPGPGWNEDIVAGISLELSRRELRQTQDHNMSDNEGTAAQGLREDEQRSDSEIEIETNKLKYFFEEADELIQLKDYTEMEIVTRRTEKIVDKLSDLISQAEELKIDSGAYSRSVRQWKKGVKLRYSVLMADKEKLSKTLKNRREEINEEHKQ